MLGQVLDVPRKGEVHTKTVDPGPVEDHRAVVTRCVGVEDTAQQRHTELATKLDAAA
jgi:hypothetical protein